MRHGPEGCAQSAAEAASSLVASRLAEASALDAAGSSALEEALPDDAEPLWLAASEEAELLWLDEPDAAALLCEELVLSELLLWELLPEAAVLWELLEAAEDAVPLDEEDAGFSSPEELLLCAVEEDVLPDVLEEVLVLPEPEELPELAPEELEELDELLDAAPLTVTSTLLLVTVQSL